MPFLHMNTYDLTAALDHLAANKYVINEAEIIAATGRSKRTVKDWFKRGAPEWVWPCILAAKGLWEVDGEYWRVDCERQVIATPERETHSLGTLRGLKYLLNALQGFKARARRLQIEVEELKAENARLRAQRSQRPVRAANDEYLDRADR